jgi:hypothetical protein
MTLTRHEHSQAEGERNHHSKGLSFLNTVQGEDADQTQALLSATMSRRRASIYFGWRKN